MDHLLQYLYKETTPEQTVEIAEALEVDADLREKLETIISAKKRLDLLNLSPEQSSIDNILKYSETYSQKGSWLLKNHLIYVISPFLLTGFFYD